MTLEITFSVDGQASFKKPYDLLVVACDPNALTSAIDYTAAEQSVFSKFKHFAIHTTLAKVKRTTQAKYGVVFSPEDNERMQGAIYAYRNETAKQFGLAVANTLEENLFTIYQVGGEVAPHDPPWTAQDFETIFAKSIDNLHWWDHGGATVQKTMFTPYFDHFDATDIADGLPWKYLDLQGTSDTLYVHASTCFESALHCWAYIRDLMTINPKGMAALPANQTTARIAIIGAGVSGILAANRLVRLGYDPKNIELLEKTDRFGGKTHTQYVEGPAAVGGDPLTVCEMGACYLSPSYVPMIEDMQKYLGGNVQIDFAARETNFRGILVPPTQGPMASRVIAYNDYVISEAARLAGFPIDHEFEKDIFYAELAYKLYRYVTKHRHYFGTELPMPMSPPTKFLSDYGDKSFGAYLDDQGMTILRPMMEYMYEVQGYGSLDQIPAFYGLIWVNPPIIIGILMGAAEKDLIGFLNKEFGDQLAQELGLEPVKMVTAWTQGWEQLWAQIVAIDGLQTQITYKTEIKSITRH